MNEAALYALEHVDKTVEIHDAISDMEELVFKGFDSAVKESISDWFGENWQCDQNYNLIQGEMYLYHIKDAPDWDKAYIALVYGGSDKNIWTFLGKNSRSGGKDYSIWLATNDELAEKPNNKMFKMEKIKALTSHGFKERTHKGKFWLQKTIFFNSEDILKGLKGEGWESALSPLKKAWQPLVDLDWDEISKIVNETQE